MNQRAYDPAADQLFERFKANAEKELLFEMRMDLIGSQGGVQ